MFIYSLHVKELKDFFFSIISSDVLPRVWPPPFCIVTFFLSDNMNSLRTYHVYICATHFCYSIFIPHPSFSQCFIMGKWYSPEVIFGLYGTIFGQWIKKSRTISFIYKDNILLLMLPITLKKTESFKKREVVLKSLSFLNGLSHRDVIGLKW